MQRGRFGPTAETPHWPGYRGPGGPTGLVTEGSGGPTGLVSEGSGGPIGLVTEASGGPTGLVTEEVWWAYY